MNEHRVSDGELLVAAKYLEWCKKQNKPTVLEGDDQDLVFSCLVELQERRAQRCETCGAAIWDYPGATDGHCYWLLDRTFEGRCNIEIERDCGCPCWESLEQWAERGIGEPTLWQPREEPQPCQ